MTAVHTIIVDWDGTAVPSMWPERPQEFMPGFVEAMQRFHRAGHNIRIFSARLNPFNPWTGEPIDPSLVQGEVLAIRDLLDRFGLTYIDIHTTPGKPTGSVYIDDKGERYNGCAKCWDKMVLKVLTRLGDETPMFPAVNR